MKIQNLFVLFALALFTTSCSDDGNPNTPAAEGALLDWETVVEVDGLVLDIKVQGSIIYIGTQAGLYTSNDAGTTFSRAFEPDGDNSPWVVDIEIHDRVFVAVREAGEESGVYLSGDGQSNWIRVSEKIVHDISLTETHALLAAEDGLWKMSLIDFGLEKASGLENGAREVDIGGNIGIAADLDGRIWSSSNAGGAWVEGLASNITDIIIIEEAIYILQSSSKLVDPEESKVFRLRGSDPSVLRPMDVPWLTSPIAVDGRDDDIFLGLFDGRFLGLQTGVFRTQFGVEWDTLGLTNLNVREIAVDGDWIWAGTSDFIDTEYTVYKARYR